MSQSGAERERRPPGETSVIQERLGSFLDSVPDAMVIADSQGRIVLLNRQAERLFGYEREELRGQPVEVLVPERLRAQHAGHRTGYVADPHVRPMGTGLDLQARRKDGSEVPVEISLSPMPTDDGGLVATAIRDVTERRQLEGRLRRQNEELEEANRLKSEFFANMSHELRTPLNAIIGFAQLMHDGKVGPVSPDHQEYLGDILVSSRHLLQLINDVLDLAKVESGKMEFHLEPVDLSRLAGETCDILRTLVAQKRMHLAVDVDPALTGIVADPAKLKQILYNYLSNALKFTPDEGHVTLRARPEGPAHFRLEVEDTGIGIKPSDLPRLFVEFQQLDATTTKKYPGTGLGLALTRRLIEAQGGQAGVHSTPGHGSTFFAVLPHVARVAARRAPGPDEAGRAARERSRKEAPDGG